MVVIIAIPVTWFSDKISKDACIHMDVRVIKADEWFTLPDLLMQPFLPSDFNLSTYLQADKLHGIYFDYEEESILIHPDKALKILQRRFRNKLKRDGLLIH